MGQTRLILVKFNLKDHIGSWFKRVVVGHIGANHINRVKVGQIGLNMSDLVNLRLNGSYQIRVGHIWSY